MSILPATADIRRGDAGNILSFYNWNFWGADLLTFITAPFSAYAGD
jgi:hypothetical protein